MKETRKSLVSVSRQVGEEWAPIFYRATTILIKPFKWSRGGARDSNAAALSSRTQVQSPRHTAEEFTKIFICTTNSRLRYVTRIKYLDYLKRHNITSDAQTGM